MDDEYRDWDSAYLLGALTYAERREYEAHFATCRDCGDAVRDLARLPAGTTVARKRKRVLVVTAAVTLAAVLVVGTLVGSVLPMGAPMATGAGALVAMQPVGTPVMTAQLSLTSAPFGTRLAWSCAYDANWNANQGAPQGYSLVITTDEGTVQTVATWGADGSAANGLTAVTNVPLSDINTVDIRPTGSNTPLLQRTL